MLNLMLDRTLRYQKFMFHLPNFRMAEMDNDATEYEELKDDESKILMDVNDETNEESEEDIESPNDNKDDMKAVMESNIDQNEWKIEYERVKNLLKVKESDKEKGGWRTQIDTIFK